MARVSKQNVKSKKSRTRTWARRRISRFLI